MVQPGTFHAIVDRLVMLGMREDLAEAYLHLLMQGAIRPGSLALVMRASRAEAYRRLQELAENDLARAGRQRPITYRPADPAAVFDILERSIVLQANVLQEARSELQPFLAGLAGSDTGTAGQTFRYLVGRSAYYDEVWKMLDEAKKEVLLVNTHHAGQELADRAGLWALLALRAEAGVRHRVLLQDTPPARRRREPGFRLLPPGQTMQFLIVDRNAMLICIVNDASDARDAPLEQFLVTSAPGFLAAHLALFECLWRQGRAADSDAQAWAQRQAAPAAGRAVE